MYLLYVHYAFEFTNEGYESPTEIICVLFVLYAHSRPIGKIVQQFESSFEAIRRWRYLFKSFPLYFIDASP